VSNLYCSIARWQWPVNKCSSARDSLSPWPAPSWRAFLDHFPSCSNTRFWGVWFFGRKLVEDSCRVSRLPDSAIYSESYFPYALPDSGHRTLGEHAWRVPFLLKASVSSPLGCGLTVVPVCVDPLGRNGIRGRFQLPVKWLIQTQFPTKTAFAF